MVKFGSQGVESLRRLEGDQLVCTVHRLDEVLLEVVQVGFAEQFLDGVGFGIDILQDLLDERRLFLLMVDFEDGHTDPRHGGVEYFVEKENMQPQNGHSVAVVIILMPVVHHRAWFCN